MRKAVSVGASLVLALVLSGCPIGAGIGGGGGGAGGGSGADDGDAGPDAAVTSECNVSTSSSVELCQKIRFCPSITVSQNTFKGCGFLANGGNIDLYCECSGYLCKASPTPSCTATSALLSTENFNEVCGQLSSGSSGACTLEALGG